MAYDACMLCTKTTDNIPNLGEKLTYKDVTAHHFCLLLTTELEQNGDSDQGILGYKRNDIRRAMKRTNQTKCYICKKKGANIRCCRKSCGLSFHLTCGLKAGCQNQFNRPFRSYCEYHIRIDKPTYVHKSNQECVICYDKMGKYDPMNSIQSPCCSKEYWYHKKCIAKYVETSGNSTKCLLCNNFDLFCQTIKNLGIYIPEKTPEWQQYDSFYDALEEFEEEPICSAKICKCWRGRSYEAMTSGRKYSFIFCHCCGAKAIHRNCMTVSNEFNDKFTCDDCEIDPGHQSIRINNNSNDVRSRDENVKFATDVEHNDQSITIQNSNFVEISIRPFSIVLRRLRSSDR